MTAEGGKNKDIPYHVEEAIKDFFAEFRKKPWSCVTEDAVHAQLAGRIEKSWNKQKKSS